MKKTVAKKITAKKTTNKKAPVKKAVAKKTKPATEGNVVAFKPKAKPKPQPKQEKAPPPQPKPHPFASFMKSGWSGKSFSAQNHKMGSQTLYRRKAV